MSLKENDIYLEAETEARIARAFAFGRKAHEGQVRKYTGDPYFETHCVSVSEAVEREGGDPNMVIAALLHDTIEDTNTTYGNILYNFGIDVAELVLELTDRYTKEAYPELNRAQRKKLEAERLGRISDRAKLIKLCDINDNSKSILELDPTFAKVYLPEKAYVLKMMGYV